MNQRWKRTLLPFLAVATVAVAGCGNNEKEANPSQSNRPEEKAQAPVEITVLAPTYGESTPSDIERIQKLNEKLNVKMNITFAPSNNYQDKLNAVLATNDLADITVVWDPSNHAWANAIAQGAFWDLTPYIKDYPNLSQIPESIYNVTAINGKLFGIPRVRPTDGHEAIIIRKDWLDKLGLPVPQTTEEFTKVLEAFTKNDPDNNGKADTYGIGASGSPIPQTYLLSMFNGPFGFAPMFGFVKDDSGRLTPRIASQETRDALSYWQAQYKAGYFAPDFPVMKGTQPFDLFIQNKVGMVMTNINQVIGPPDWQTELRKSVPDAVVQAIELPAAADGKRYYEKASGSFGILMINKKVPEEKLKKILEVMDYTSTQEGFLLVASGIEGKDYEVPNPKLPLVTKPSEAAAALNSQHNQWIPGYFNKYLRAESGLWSDEMNDYSHQLVDSIEKQSVLDLSLGITSVTWNEQNADWSKKINDMIVNVIIGKNTVEDWDQLIRKLQSEPAWDKIVQEVNESYSTRSNQ